jgi:molecular chaperone DnaJ
MTTTMVMTMSVEHAYAELGLEPGAPEADVKRAWRRLASHWHPDRNPSAEASQRMQRLNLALAHIRREGYAAPSVAPARRPPHASADSPQAHARAAAEDAPPPAPEPDIDPQATPAPDATSEAAGSTGRPAGASYPDADVAAIDPAADDAAYTEGRPLQRCIRLTLEEAAAGCVRTLHGRVMAHCGACAGIGHQVLGQACKPCDGRGSLRQGGWFGWYSLPPTPCDHCGGDGLARQPCALCGGMGQMVPHEFHLPVRIPHGARHGDELQVIERRSQRAAAHADHPAPVEIHLRVELLPHPLFELDPDDGTLRCEMPIDGFQWLAQRSIDVPTLDAGLLRLRLTRGQLVYTLPGQGYPISRRGDTRADLVLTLKLQFPDRFSTDQDILLDQLIATTCGPASPPPPAGSPLGDWAAAMRAWQAGAPERAQTPD